MMRFFLYGLAVLSALSAFSLAKDASCPLPTDFREIDDGLIMREVVNPSTNLITVQLTYQGEAWLGFGVNPDGEMIGGDAVIGLPDTGSVLQYDMSQESLNGVTPWTTQSLSEASITQANGVTTLTFTMPLVNTDQHEILTSDANTFLYAYGRSNELATHARAKSFTVDTALLTCDLSTGTTVNYDGSISTPAPVATSEPESTVAPTSVPDFDEPTDTSTTPTTPVNGSTSSCPFPSDSRTLVDGILTMKEVVNPSDNTISIQMVYQGEAWLGFGISPDGEMIGADSVIGLPDSGLVEQNDMTGEGLSFVTPWSEQSLTDATITQADGVTTLSFTMPLVNDNQHEIFANGPNTFLYAIGGSNELGTHAQARSFTIEEALVACDPTSESTPTYDGSNTVGVDADESEQLSTTQKQKLWIAHGCLLSISWGILVPLAIGCSVLRDSLPSGGMWFMLHSNLNLLALLTTVAGFSIAVYLLGKEGDKHFSGERHNTLGLIVFLLMFVQAVSGLFRPKLPEKNVTKTTSKADWNEEDGAVDENQEHEQTSPSKSRLRVLFEIQHRMLGLGLLGLSWYQVFLGITLFDEQFGSTFSANTVFFAVAGTITGLIVLGKVGTVALSKR